MVYIISIVVFVLLIAFIIYVYKESTEYEINEYNLFSDKIKKDTKIVFLSDLHNKMYDKDNTCLYEDIVKINPDFIVFGGDMVTSCAELDYDFSKTIGFIKKLRKKYTIYYGMGNHEERFYRKADKYPGMYKKLTKALNKIGCPILKNEVIDIPDRNIKIYGLNLEHAYFRKFKRRVLPKDYLEKVFGKVDEKAYSVLIAHNPEHFYEYSFFMEDLCLSGHVHGGVMQIPFIGGIVSPAISFFPKYSGGMYKENGSTMILGRGIGGHTPKIRINNKAEIVVINIHRVN